MGVAHICGKNVHHRLDVDAHPVPFHNLADGEGVPEVMDSWLVDGILSSRNSAMLSATDLLLML